MNAIEIAQAGPSNNPSGDIPDSFADTVTRLGKTIEASMVSLYDLQTATINAEAGEPPSLSIVFRGIREPLRSAWETLIAFFKSCHAFGGDILFLKESMRTESFDDCLHFLLDMGNTSEELLETASKLRKTIIIPIYLFDQKQDKFLALFRKSGSIPSPYQRAERRNTDEMCRGTTPVNDDFHRENATASFVDTALASLYPDGEEVLVATQNHFSNMRWLYHGVVAFWKTQHDEFLAASNSTMDARRINEIVEAWVINQKALTATIGIISRACDAIGVEAKGAPCPTKIDRPLLQSVPSGLRQTASSAMHTAFSMVSSTTLMIMPHAVTPAEEGVAGADKRETTRLKKQRPTEASKWGIR